MNETIAKHEARSPWPLALAMATLVFVTAWFYVRHVPVGQPPDEWAHLSYIADITSGGPPIPNYSNSTLLKSGQQNYLQHPPLYYTVLGLVGKTLSWDPVKDYQRYRTISALMVALGVFFWVLAAVRLGFTTLQAAGLTGASLAIPMFPYLAGSVNNDNLCYLGVAIFFYGFILLPSRHCRGTYICALGLLTVLFTKATGAVFLLAFLIAWCCLDRNHLRSLAKERHVWVAAAITAVICIGYYLPTAIHYHVFFPAPGGLYQDRTAPLQPIGFFGYFDEFMEEMFDRLPIVLAAKAFFPIPRDLFFLFYLMLGMPLAAWLLFRPFSRPGPQRHLADAFLLALLATLAIHLWVGWQGYLRTGLYAGLQPRYYAYALPGLFLFAFADGVNSRVKRTLLYGFSLIAVVFVALIPPKASVEHFARQRQEYASHLQAPDLSSALTSTLGAADPSIAAGSVDQIQVIGNEVRVSGWAIDAASKRPARALWVSFHDRLIGTAQPLELRPDVANALGSDSALRAGFVITVSHIPASLSPCEVTVQAEQGNGTLATLPSPGCVQIKANQ